MRCRQRETVNEGIVPGGGAALLRAVTLAGDAEIASRFVRSAWEEPTRQIANNAGQEGAVGIVDHTKVTRSALQTLISVASVMLGREARPDYSAKTNMLLRLILELAPSSASGTSPLKFVLLPTP
jgi:chaperonin GroEL (HSP60 family)